MKRRIGVLLTATYVLMASGCSTSFKHGRELYSEGRYSEAVKELSQFTESHPNDPVAHFVLADALYLGYSKDFSQNRASANDLNLSLIHYSRAIELNPHYAEAYGQRGVVYLTLGETQAAKRDYDKAIELNPSLDRPYFNRGFWHEKQGELPEAIEDYKKYVSLSSNNQWRDDATRRIEALEMKIELNRLNKPKKMSTAHRSS